MSQQTLPGFSLYGSFNLPNVTIVTPQPTQIPGAIYGDSDCVYLPHGQNSHNVSSNSRLNGNDLKAEMERIITKYRHKPDVMFRRLKNIGAL